MKKPTKPTKAAAKKTAKKGVKKAAKKSTKKGGKKKAAAKKMGRPSGYSKKVADAICALVAENKSIRTICIPETMPSTSTFSRWLMTNPDFRAQYARAKEASADAMAEELLDIADDGTNDWMLVEGRDGEEREVVNHEHIQRSKLRIDTRKFLMSKLKAKKYGDKLEVDNKHSGHVEVAVSDEDREAVSIWAKEIRDRVKNESQKETPDPGA